MDVYTLKVSRRREAEKRRQARDKQERAELVDRACKAVNLSGPRTPAQEVSALERYIDSLIALRNELQAKQAVEPEYSGAAYWVTREIRDAVSELVKIRIRLLNAERLGI